MAKLYIYDKFGELLEQHEITSPLTDWLKSSVKSYRESCAPPYSATLNGKPWPYANHGKHLSADDQISLTIEPQDPISIILTVVAVASAAYAYSIASNMPKGYEQAAQDGSSVYNANSRANVPRPSGLIREVAGAMQIYPDLIAPPYRYYEDNFEYLSVLLSVGAGYFDLNTENLFISETSVLNYIPGATLTIYDPDETLSANDQEIWVTSKEAADLTISTTNSNLGGVWTADFSGATMTTYLDSGSGPVVTQFPYAVGDIFELISGPELGVFKVISLSGGSNQTATLDEMQIDTALIEIYNPSRVQTIRGQFTTINTSNQEELDPRIYASIGAATFTLAAAQSVEFKGLLGGINWFGPYKLTEDGVSATSIELDLSFNQGLVFVNSSGTKNNHTVELEVQYREFGTGTWSTTTLSFTDNFLGQRVFTETISLSGTYEPEFRVRRLTREKTDIGYYEEVSLVRAKSLISGAPTSYPDITSCRLTIRGTDNLSSSAENRINIRGATRKLPTLAELQAASNGTPFDISRAATAVSGDWNSDYLNYAKTDPIGRDTYSGTGLENESTSFSWSSNGLYLLMCGKVGAKILRTNEAFNPSVMTLVGSTGITASRLFNGQCFLMDSGNFYVVLSGDFVSFATIKYYTCSTPFNPSTATETGSYSFVDLELEPKGVYVKPDGTKLFVIYDSFCSRYTMSTPNDVTTITRDNQFSLGGAIDCGTFADFDGAGLPTRAYIYDSPNIKRYAFGTAGDITTLSLELDDGTLSNIPGAPKAMYASADNFHFIYASAAGDSSLYQYVTINFIDSRATRSRARFVGNALYNALGSRAADLVDWSALSALEAIWESRSDFLDAEFVDETTLWEAIKIMLSGGYSDPVVKDGKFLPVRTIQGSDYQHIYTPDVMTDDGVIFDYSIYDSEEPDGVEVEYFSLATYRNEVVQCLASGDLGINPRRIQAIGITDQTRAWRLGMRERNRARYKPAQITFSTEMDALNSEYGDPIAVCSEMLASQCGEVTAYSAPTVTLDFNPEFGVGTYFAAFRKPNGKMSGLYTVAAGGSPNQITLSSPATLDFTPVTDNDSERTLVSLGLSTEWGIRAIVRRIDPSGDNIVQVTAEEYLPEVYQDDDNLPPS